MSTGDLKAGKAALAAAARAFARAQAKGYVWIGEQGAFETSEPEIGGHRTPKNINRDQLRLA